MPPSPGTLRHVPIERLTRNPEQPRSAFDPEALQGLAESIRVHGVLNPILVREEGGRFVIVAGERRWRASGLAGLKEVPVLVTDEASERKDRLILALVENLQRDDLDPVDEARGFRRLNADFKLSQEEIARMVGRDRTTVTNALRLLRLPDGTLEALQGGRIRTGHAKALLSLHDPARITEVVHVIEDRDLSVRATERLVQRLNEESERAPREIPAPLRRAADLLTRSLGAPVEIRPSSKGGSIVIRYSADDELTALVERLGGEE